MATPAIETHDLAKTYGEDVRALAGCPTASASGSASCSTGPIRQLSKGNRQKVGVVQAFMHRPDLFILDEPTSGLDPLLEAEFRTLLWETVAEGRTCSAGSPWPWARATRASCSRSPFRPAMPRPRTS